MILEPTALHLLAGGAVAAIVKCGPRCLAGIVYNRSFAIRHLERSDFALSKVTPRSSSTDVD